MDANEDVQSAKRRRVEDTGDQRDSDDVQFVASYGMDANEDVQSAKRRRVEVTGDQRDSDASDQENVISTTADQSDSDDEEFDVGVVFALDISTSVSEEECKEEVKFVKHLTESWNNSTSTENRMGVGLVVYGEGAKAIPYPDGNDLFPVQLHELRTKWRESKSRKMDLALTTAADYFKSSSKQHQLVVLITTGAQISDAKNKEDNKEHLISASEELSSRNIKVIIVPVGLETDFKELGLIVNRPQSLLPVYSFKDMTPAEVQNIVTMIKQTSDIVKYAKKKVATFTGEPPINSGMWENSSLCCDVLEGTWYCLYDDKKKPKRTETVRKFIRESIDSFHRILVTESKISISLVVFGPLGAGKSFFLNFLMNWGLRDDQKLEKGPLPSADGGSQTPFPIYLKYGKKVQVLYRQKNEDRQKGISPEIWFAENELGNGTLKKVKNVLVSKFETIKTGCVELQGPFPVFRHLKCRTMTSTGQLELEVDVEFVDVPGCGDKSGNDSIDDELSKADVVLFFGWGQSNRPVSSEDIAQVFRRCEELEFTSRPKLVHVINDRTESSSESWNLEDKKKELTEAWDCFLESSSLEDEAKARCYRDVRAKLPQLNGQALLDKLSNESEVIYFHSKNDGVVDSLKKVISDHVQCVKIKETVHPFLQNIHFAAKKLKARIGSSIATEKRKQKTNEVKEGQAVFEIVANRDNASDLVTSFLNQTNLPLDLDIKGIHRFLHDKFLCSGTTLTFLNDALKQSLGNFTSSLIYSFMNANWTAVQVVPEDLLEVVEILCESRVEQFCANSAPAYLVHVLDKKGNQSPFDRKQKKDWSIASPENRKDLCGALLHTLLRCVKVSLEKEPRDKQNTKSHFQLIKQLRQDVKDLFAVRSLDDDASKTDLLVLLHKKLQGVIDYCHNSIREINPHPCLDVKADISIPDPEKMENAHQDETIRSVSTHEEIIKEAEKLLLKPGVQAGADAIRKLESKLNYGKGGLKLRHSQSVDQRLWAEVLINVLSDKDHFNIQRSFVLDDHDAEVKDLVKLAQKRLFAHQKSCVTCNIVHNSSRFDNDNEIHLKKSSQENNCLEVLISYTMSGKLDAIREGFADPSRHLAPIFIPTIRPGPTPGIRGNYFLEENPWDKGLLIDDRLEKTREKVGEGLKEGHTLNIFLVVEQHHLKTFQTTIENLWRPNNVNLMYIVLPQKGRGIGVTRAIIKSLAECFKFSLYWTIDDDLQFMYQFDGNDRRWHKCSITRGLLFGQRVFQTCLEKTVKDLSEDERDQLFDDITSSWSAFATKTKTWRRARSLLLDQQKFAKVQKNPALLHSPFANSSEDCGGDVDKEKELKLCEQTFVEECRKRLFEETVNYIAGVSLAHESSKKYDYMGKYPKADYMCSEQRYQVVLHNAAALKGMNYVTDEMIFLDKEFQVYDEDKRNTPYWGIRGSDKSFCHALAVRGVIGYQVIRIVHSHKKLTNVFDRVGPSYIASQSPHRSEDEDDDTNMDDNK